MRIIVIISFLFLIGCAKPIQYQGKRWPSSLNPIMDRYLDEAGKNSVSIPNEYLLGLSITFGDAEKVGKNTIGYCQTYNETNRRDITLDIQYWDNTGDASHSELLWHELGHCLLNYQHRGIIDPVTGEPTSIMYPYAIWPISYFEQNLDEYEREYWHPIK